MHTFFHENVSFWRFSHFFGHLSLPLSFIVGESIPFVLNAFVHIHKYPIAFKCQHIAKIALLFRYVTCVSCTWNECSTESIYIFPWVVRLLAQTLTNRTKTMLSCTFAVQLDRFLWIKHAIFSFSLSLSLLVYH